MKNKFMIGTVLTGMLLIASPVEAMGNAKVVFNSNDNIKVGETFTVKMSVTDINNTYDGIVSLGGNLSFDESKLEYVSSKGVETPYLFQINEDYEYKIAGLDFTLDNGIRETLTVYEFTFKALKEGTTTITLENTKLTDSQDYINTTVIEKQITIDNKVEDKEETKDIETEIIPEEKNIIKETPIIETKTEKTTNKVIKIDKTTKTEVEETKKEANTEEKVEIIVEKTENKKVVKEKVTFIEKVQKAFNDLFTKLRNLFK